MNCVLKLLILGLLFATPSLLAQSKLVEANISDVANGVVQLSIYEGGEPPFKALTGLVLTKDGVIATSASAIEKATWIGVTIDGKEYSATDVALVDTTNDIALIRINASGLTPVNLKKVGTVVKGKAVYELTYTGKEIAYSEGEAGKPEKVGKARVLTASFKWAFNQNGGALLNAQGKLAGMISTKLGGATPITHINALIKKLKKIVTPLKTLAQTKPVLGPEVRKTFHPNGVIQSERTYVRNQLEGPSKFYDELGRLKREEFYKDNLLDSLARDFYPDGKVKTEVFYKAGKKHGIAKTYNELGWLESEATFENDNLIGLIKGYEYYPGGELKATYTTTIDGVLTGQKRIYYPDGMLAAEENYVVGKLDGLRRTYYDNGLLEKAQTWRNGFQVGVERIFFPSGKLKEENKFNDAGIMIESKIYDERGRKIEDLDAGEIAERNRKREQSGD